MADYSNPDTVSALATIDPELDAVSGTQARSGSTILMQASQVHEITSSSRTGLGEPYETTR